MTSSTTVRSPLRLYGREDELGTLEHLLTLLRRGVGGALVLVAPPGLGRTALLRAAAAAHRARGPVLYAGAATAERAVPCGGLGALLGPGTAGAGPAAFARSTGSASAALPTGTGTVAVPAGAGPSVAAPDALVGRLREFADGRPLLVCVDDAHAWDPVSRAALTFAALGPLTGSGIAFLLSAADGAAFEGLPALHLTPLEEDAASALLDRLTSGTDGPDPVVRAELLREAGGNPALLTGLTARLTPDQLAGRTPLPWPLPGGEALPAAHAERLDRLPDRARTLLLLAAAAEEHEPAGAGADTLLLLRAGTRAGLPRAFLDDALLDGAGTGGLLRRTGGRVHFAHRLAARAVLDRAPWSRRRAAHELLATVLVETGGGGGGAPAGPGSPGARELRGFPELLETGAPAVLRAGAPESLEAGAPAAHSAGAVPEAPGARLSPEGRKVPETGGPEALEAGAPEVTEARDFPEPSSLEARSATALPEPPGTRSFPEAVDPGAPGASSAIVLPGVPEGRKVPQPGGPEVSEVPEPGFPEVRAGTAGSGPPALPLAALVQWACAAPGPDAALAARLEAAAVAPSSHAERSAALARAALLSTGPALRAARFAAAAEQARLAGDPPLARALLARSGPPAADADPATAPESAPGLAPYVHGMLALRSGPVADAREVLKAAAALLVPHDPGRARDALLGAAEAAWAAGDAVGYLDVMHSLTRTPADERLAHYRGGMSAVLEGRTAEGHAHLRRALAVAGDTGDPATLLRAGVAALVLGDVSAACRTGARALAAVRTRGPDALLPHALEHLAYAELRAGRHAGARAHALEGLHAARRTGQSNTAAHLHAVLALAASVEGPGEACAAHADAALAGAGPHGLTQAATLATWARARADLAAGRPGDAAARLAPLVGSGPGRGHFATRTLAVPCWIEAAVLDGRLPAQSRELHTAVDEFATWADRAADPGAPAQLARCRALLAPAGEADARYGEALAHHEQAGGEFERARTRLLYGLWLRRRRRTREARDPLRDALVGFQRCSARAWADRAAGELRAAGEPAGARPDPEGDPLAGLTPQQQRIARCVAEGDTNREVARRLSLSPRTVDHHLRNVFAALGIRSRTELARLSRP
ncbi:LuxR C-terminal-related transcriptional regulator [Streptomyces sp. NPDC090126]|uniref:LuxR C-terminal-related transcriptional regulator n=1 Tax=unclassified Streptomyces TaxID=2593676 RepID=UPI003803E3D6